ncbi:MAG: TonB-dependent receptor, partial [Verrucomicrobiota bacterium]
MVANKGRFSEALVVSGSLGGSGNPTRHEAFGNAINGRQSQYTGNLAFLLDNSVWDAQGVSLNGLGTPKPAYAKGRASFSIGGPLGIPKVINNRVGTFTLNYQVARTRNGSTLYGTVPSAAARGGDFSQSSVQGTPVRIYDPSSAEPFPDNTIPRSRLNRAAVDLAVYYPLPATLSQRLNYQRAIMSANNNDNLDLHASQPLSKRDRLSVNFTYQQGSTTTPNLVNFLDTVRTYNINPTVAWTHTIRKTLFNTLTYSFTRTHAQTVPYFSMRNDVELALGINGGATLPVDWGTPNLSFTNFSGLSDANASLLRNQSSMLNEKFTWVRGSHSLSFGSDYTRAQVNELANVNARGSFSFSGIVTSHRGIDGYDFADFLLGLPSTASLRLGNPDKYIRLYNLDAWVADDWHISNGLTVNYGARYDYFSPATELRNRLANLLLSPGITSVTQVQAGSPGAPASLVNPDRDNFSIRFGVAWRPFPNQRKRLTVIRAGYGKNYIPDAYRQIASNLAQQPPFATV